jgi:hypothetical protein
LILKFKDCFCNAFRTHFSNGPPKDFGAGMLLLTTISLQLFLAVVGTATEVTVEGVVEVLVIIADAATFVPVTSHNTLTEDDDVWDA